MSPAPRSGPPEAIDIDELPEHPKVRLLRRLVLALTVVSTLSVASIAAALVFRITQPPASPPGPVAITAPAISLPAGERITATGTTAGALMLVTVDEAGAELVRLFDATTGAPLHSVSVERERR